MNSQACGVSGCPHFAFCMNYQEFVLFFIHLNTGIPCICNDCPACFDQIPQSDLRFNKYLSGLYSASTRSVRGKALVVFRYILRVSQENLQSIFDQELKSWPQQHFPIKQSVLSGPGYVGLPLAQDFSGYIRTIGCRL